MIQFGGSVRGKVVVVTGGSGVLGSRFCEALAENGAKVAVIGRSREKAERVAERIRAEGGIALPIVADVLEADQMMSAKKEIDEKLGSCDVLINGAGGNHPKANTTHDFLEEGDLREGAEGVTTFFDLAPEQVKEVFDLNFLGTLIPTQVFARDMAGKKGAAIINVSSMNAFRPLTRIPAYSGAKAAVSNFTQWLAVYFAKAGIRVNAIAPGFFLTEQNRGLLLNQDGGVTERAQKILSQTPMGRFGNPDELIGTLLWLIDEEASGFVNGVVIPVDGGFNAYAGV